MKQLTTSFVFYFLLSITFLSCRKNLNQDDDPSAIFPTTEEEKNQVALIKEVASILETVYQDPYAYYEVNTTIYSEYYDDERVLLKDLLFPNYSPLYKTEKFLSFKAEKGRFSKVFFETMYRGNFPLLRKALNVPSQIGRDNSRDFTMATSPIDTSIEIFSNSKGVSIYFPYSENFSVPLTVSYFDKVNTPPYITYLATIVSADREADTGPGREPKKINSDSLKFIEVTISDTYAESKPTHIVGVGAVPTVSIPLQPQSVDVVFLGNILCNTQYDRLISFSSLNGGGPELRFMRGDAYMQQVNGQITNPQATLPVNLSRKDCRSYGRWKKIYAQWDSNWEPSNLNQIFGIWEEDNSGTKTMSGTLQTTLTTQGGGTTVNSIGYSFTVTTKDPIIRQMTWNRESFFLYNRGGLNNGCGTWPAAEQWTIYDCSQGVRYTLPTQ